MRTTLNIPDALVMDAKRRALEEGTTLTDLLVEGLRSRLSRGVPTRQLPVSRATGGLIKGLDWTTLISPGPEGEGYR